MRISNIKEKRNQNSSLVGAATQEVGLARTPPPPHPWLTPPSPRPASLHSGPTCPLQQKPTCTPGPPSEGSVSHGHPKRPRRHRSRRRNSGLFSTPAEGHPMLVLARPREWLSEGQLMGTGYDVFIMLLRLGGSQRSEQKCLHKNCRLFILKINAL